MVYKTLITPTIAEKYLANYGYVPTLRQKGGYSTFRVLEDDAETVLEYLDMMGIKVLWGKTK